MINNIAMSIAIFLLVAVSSVAMYLPLLAWSKDKLLSQKFAIPFSVSIEIIIGYLFYSTNSVNYFPITYLVFMAVANIWAYLKLKPITIKKAYFKWSSVTAIVIVVAGAIYTRYYDSFSFTGPGGNDAHSHLMFINDLLTIGHLSNGFYAPGFHLFLMPIAELIPLDYLYRFTGPAIGVITALALAALIKDYLKNKVLLIFFLVLLMLPIFNPFTLQTINFFSSSLSFIYVAAFIFLASDRGVSYGNYSRLLMLAFVLALAVTVPYLFVTLIPAFLLILVTELVEKKRFKEKYAAYLLRINILLVVGFIVSLGHVYLQSNILKRYYGFPTIATTTLEPSVDSVAGADDGSTSNDELVKKFKLPSFFKNNAFVKPMIGTGVDMLRVKNIRSYYSVLGFGSYLWIFLSLFILMYAIRKKNSTLLIVAVLSIFFGICTQTGVFEMSYYRGRSGWYLLMFSVIGTVLFIDQAFSPKIIRLFLPASILLALTGFLLPPKFYRPYYDGEFAMARQIARQHPDEVVTFISKNKQLNVVASNIVVLELKKENLLQPNSYLIIEDKIFEADPALSQGAVSTDKDLSKFRKKNEAMIREQEEKVNEIKSSQEFGSYNHYFSDGQFTIYKN